MQREAIPFVVFERQALAELARRPKAALVEYRAVQLQNDPLFARWFAHAYAGVDPD